RPDGSRAGRKITNSNTVLVLIHKHEGLRWRRSGDIGHFLIDVPPITVGNNSRTPVHVTVHGNASHPWMSLPANLNPGFIRRALVDGRTFRVGSDAAVSARHEQ